VWFLSEETNLPRRRRYTVADELRIGLQELLRKAQVGSDANFLKEGVRALSQAIMEMEVEDHIGAAHHQRGPGRTGQRNGYRQRLWDTRVGTVELDVPRVRDSSYFPSLLQPRRRAERALSAVVQEAYVHGVSTRKVDELVKALGMTGISKSRVSEVCEELDEEVERFRGRQLEGSYPYVWLDATYVKARPDG
jgi:putative transposase